MVGWLVGTVTTVFVATLQSTHAINWRVLALRVRGFSGHWPITEVDLHFDHVLEHVYVKLNLPFVLCVAGAPALTTRGFKEDDFRTVVNFLDESISIAVKAQQKTSEI